MIEGPIKFKPQNYEDAWPLRYDYMSPDGALRNVDRIVGNYVQMWSRTGWGNIHNDSVSEKEFREKWSEYQPESSVTI